MEAARRTGRVPWLGRMLLCLTSQGPHPHPGSAQAGVGGGGEIRPRKAKAAGHTREAGPRHQSSQEQQRCQRRKWAYGQQSSALSFQDRVNFPGSPATQQHPLALYWVGLVFCQLSGWGWVNGERGLKTKLTWFKEKTVLLSPAKSSGVPRKNKMESRW